MQASRRARWAARYIALGLLIAQTTSGLAQQRPLLERATQVMQMSYLDSYCWLSNREMLISHSTVQKATFLRHDLETGKETPLPALTSLYNKRVPMPTTMELSPDGKWLMCLFDDGEEGYGMGLKVDGSRAFSMPIPAASLCFWMRDGRHWIEFVRDSDGEKLKRAVIHEIGSRRVVKTLPIRRQSLLNRYEGLHVVQRASTNRILVHTGCNPDKAITKVDIFETRLDSDFQRTRNFTIHLSSGATLESLMFSPQGDHIAWLLRFKSGKLAALALWVSQLDGSKMHEIGRGETMNPDRIGGLEPQYIGWQPDGKRLSFVYKDALYTVPVD